MNKELLLKVNAWVQAEAEKQKRGEPSEWDQSEWVCATGCCFAGKVVQECGAEIIKIDDDGQFFECKINGCQESIQDAAMEFLIPGYDDDDFDKLDCLFDASNDAEAINEIVQEIIAIHEANQ